MIKVNDIKQYYFDFDLRLFGFREIATGKLKEVYSSGIYFGLPISFDSRNEAEEELKRYTTVAEYFVEEFSDAELLDYLNERDHRHQIARG